MSERPVKRLRRLSTEDDDDDVTGSDDWIPEDVKAKAGAPNSGRTSQQNDHITARSRTTRGVAIPASATVHRTSSAASGQRSIRLTVKAPPSKLRAVTMGSESPEVEKRPSSSASRRSSNSKSQGRETLSRGSKNRPAIVERDEDDDDDMDVDMDDEDEVVTRPLSSARGKSSAPTPTPATAAAKPSLTFRIPKKPGTETKKPSPEQLLKAAPKITAVEDKQVALANASDDEELSELDDDDEIEGREEDVDEEEEEQDEDSEEDGDSDDDEEAEEEEDDDAEADTDSDQEMTEIPSAFDQLTSAAAENASDSELDTSQTGTPDPSRLTRRQRGAPDDTLLALSNEATKKKFLTAEQVTMRKAEMARRRKDLSEKRAQEEKDDTLKRLLEKQPSKKKGGLRTIGEEDMEVDEDGEVVKFRAKPGWVRTVMGVEGTRVGVPEEWLEAPAGRVFEGCKARVEGLKVTGGTRLVQEVE